MSFFACLQSDDGAQAVSEFGKRLCVGPDLLHAVSISHSFYGRKLTSVENSEKPIHTSEAANGVALNKARTLGSLFKQLLDYLL